MLGAFVMELISIIVPCYNEQEVLPLFYNEITKTMNKMRDCLLYTSIPFYNRWLAKLDDIYDSGIYLKEYKKSITNNLRNCRRQTETEYNLSLIHIL